MSVLGRDEASAYERWELPAVGEPAVRRVKEEPSPLPTIADLEAIERQAREEGFNAGLVEGRATARRELLSQTGRLEALYTAAARPLAELDDAVARELAWLATVVAERVLGVEISLRPEKIIEVVRQAVHVLPAAERHVRVVLHPDDAALVRDHRNSAEDSWLIVEDRTLDRGDCRLESEHSRIDARLRSRLATVVDAVLGDDRVDEEPEA
ncbi:FliH/SctL family protein [Pinirhizobacter sp.]|jgi:flagellar assembly protein FliH|uniref:FliH/SctL family protein n=1 Tax=Pinirhizobacter sp. TaxID=2950432 RepID=UPI002F40D3B5